MKIWLDDFRDPTIPFWQKRSGAHGDEVWVKTAEEAMEWLGRGVVTYISLDNDLGEGGSGYDVAQFIEQGAFDATLPRLECHVHTDNTAARDYMLMAIANAIRYWDGKRY